MRINTDEVRSNTTILTGNLRFNLQILSKCLENAIRREPRLMQTIGDRGSFAIISALLAGAGSEAGSVTLADVNAAVVPRGLATSRRVRALVEWLEHCGGLERVRTATDARRRPFQPSGWLIDALQDALAAAFGASGPSWAADRARANPRRTITSFARRILPFVLDAEALSPEVASLTEHRGGYLLMLRLICEARQDADGAAIVDLSRKGFARAHHLSRAHVTALIARAERRGWLTRLPGETIRLDPGFHSAWQLFLARQIAILNQVAGK